MVELHHFLAAATADYSGAPALQDVQWTEEVILYSAAVAGKS